MTEDRFGGIDDATLVRRVADGSEDALAALYDRHAEALFAAAVRFTGDRGVAEEVVQESFLALWNRAELYEPRAGSLAAWLHAIARNRAIDRLRAQGRRPRLVSFVGPASSDETEAAALDRASRTGAVLGGAHLGPGPEGMLASVELRETLRAALTSMPDTERMVILLAYQEELSQAEIATRLGWPLGTVKTRTRRALLRLREVLAGELGPEDGREVGPVPTGDRS